MVLESQLAWTLSEQLSWRVTDPSPAPSLASFSYLLMNSLLTEAPSMLADAKDTALSSKGSWSLE